MIPSRELREKARKYGVPESTVERDYAQNWILWALSDIEMAFKGGTCIKKIYIPDYRFSDDLDFTLLEDMKKDELNDLIKESVFLAKDESGIPFLDEIGIEENFNGFEISIYFRMLWTGGSPTKIKLDITKYEGERIMLPLREMPIIHDYSDGLNASIKAYSLEEIFAEKMRSLFQRTRPRDLYDVWKLKDLVDIGAVMDIIPEKFEFRGVILDIEALLSREEKFKSAWNTSLSHQISALPNFDDVFKDVIETTKKVFGHDDG